MMRVTHNYGIKITTSIAHAKKVNRKNGNNPWMKALEKEMIIASIIVFYILDHGVGPLPG